MVSNIDINKFRKRIYGCCVGVGTFISLNHARCNKPGNGQIYKVLRKVKDGAFTILFLRPIRGRNQDIKVISGERFVYVARN